MKDGINFGWIEIALENGAELTAKRNEFSYSTSVSWDGKHIIRGNSLTSLALALSVLNNAIADDAGDEMIKRGAV